MGMSNNIALEGIKKLVSEANELASSFTSLRSGFQTEVKDNFNKPLTEEEQYLGELKDILARLQAKLKASPC